VISRESLYTNSIMAFIHQLYIKQADNTTHGHSVAQQLSSVSHDDDHTSSHCRWCMVSSRKTGLDNPDHLVSGRLGILGKGPKLTSRLGCNMLDTLRALRFIRPNGRAVGQRTRRKAMQEALACWVTYVGCLVDTGLPKC
jgi:hypothetical protein